MATSQTGLAGDSSESQWARTRWRTVPNWERSETAVLEGMMIDHWNLRGARQIQSTLRGAFARHSWGMDHQTCW